MKGIQKLLSDRLSATKAVLSGGEEVGIDGVSVYAFAEPDALVEDLMLGASGDHREVSVMVPSADLGDSIPSTGAGATFRGQDWKISSVDYHPATTTRIVLRSPARRV